VIGPDEDGDGDWRDDAGPYAEANPIRFSTKYWDDETGLGYWGYRYHSPRLGRWISRDPLREDGGFNLYALVHNDPVNRADPDGRQEAKKKHLTPGTFDVMWGEQSPDKKGIGSSLTVRYTLTKEQAACCEYACIIQTAETEANVIWGIDDMRPPHIDRKKLSDQDAPFPCLNSSRMLKSSTKTWVETDDEPGFDKGAEFLRKFSQTFEGCAVCIRGACKGTIYGCRKYGHYLDKETNKLKRWGGGIGLRPEEPSATFRDLLSDKKLEFEYRDCGCPG